MENLEDIFIAWINRKKEENIKQSSLANYYNISPYIKVLLDNNIKDYLNIITSKNIKSKTQYDIITVVNNFFMFAYREKYINLYIHIKHAKIEQDEVETFTDNEVKKIDYSICNDPDYIKVGIILSLYTGIRIGELCALTWTNIDLESKIIKIRYTLQRIKNIDNNINSKTCIVIDTPKTKKSLRNIPIPNFLIPLLNKFKSENNCYLLTGKTKYMEPRTMQKHFKKFLDTLNIKNKNFHCLRHTFATNAYFNGMSIMTLSDVLGHMSEEFTKKRYVHSNILLKQEEMNSIYNSKSFYA